MPASPFRFNPVAGRFIGPNGKFVSQATINGAVKQAAKDGAREMNVLTRQMAEGTLDIQAWQTQMMAEIKASQLAAAALAKGGFERMTQADYGRVGQQVRVQYGHLQAFAQQLANGAIPLDGRVPRRAELYIEAAKGMFDRQQRIEMLDRGMTHERNILNATESCDECIAASDMDWVEIGTLPPVGTRTCLSRCQCEVEYEARAA